MRRLLALVLLVAGLAAAPAVSAGSTAVLTVQLVPGSVSAGKPALAVVSFANESRVTLPNVAVTLNLPDTLNFVPTPGCTVSARSTHTARCPFGDVPAGKRRHVYVNVKVIAKLTDEQRIAVGFQLRVGPGFPRPIITSASTLVLASNNAAHRGTCDAKPRTLTATLGAQSTVLQSPPVADPALGLPCTPLAVGVDPKPDTGGYKTGVASVDLPKLSHPTIVKLVFANETLPDEGLIDNLPPGKKPSFDNPNPLWRLDPANPNVRYVVPKCKPGPAFPPGWRSCIIHVHAVDIGPGEDTDQGWITLLVQGAGFGDPRYVG